MRKIFTVTTIFILCIAFIYANYENQSIIETIKATSTDNSVNIEWRTRSELNVSRFEIERSSSNSIFSTIGIEKAKGTPANYIYRDNDSFTKTTTNPYLLAKRTLTYRVKIVYSDGSSSTSSELIVTHNMSSIKRTWGMIKEMFK